MLTVGLTMCCHLFEIFISCQNPPWLSFFIFQWKIWSLLHHMECLLKKPNVFSIFQNSFTVYLFWNTTIVKQNRDCYLICKKSVKYDRLKMCEYNWVDEIDSDVVSLKKCILWLCCGGDISIVSYPVYFNPILNINYWQLVPLIESELPCRRENLISPSPALFC